MSCRSLCTLYVYIYIASMYGNVMCVAYEMTHIHACLPVYRLQFIFRIKWNSVHQHYCITNKQMFYSLFYFFFFFFIVKSILCHFSASQK